MCATKRSEDSSRPPLDLTDRLILYLVKNLTEGSPDLLLKGGGVITTMLAKLLFLIDVWSMETNSAQITDFRYIRYKHGPYPVSQFEDRMERLGPWGLNAVGQVSQDGEKHYRVYRLADPTQTLPGLPDYVQLLADGVMSNFANQKLADVLAHVYALPFIRRASFGKEIDLGQLKPKGNNLLDEIAVALGEELERPLSAEHLAVLKQDQSAATTDNNETARAMRLKQRKAFRQKYGS